VYWAVNRAYAALETAPPSRSLPFHDRPALLQFSGWSRPPAGHLPALLASYVIITFPFVYRAIDGRWLRGWSA
jgi:hypothetical protein